MLKALKISYWRQYEHGKISKDGVRTLVQAVEVAADSDNGKINLEQLGTLWKPKVSTIYPKRLIIIDDVASHCQFKTFASISLAGSAETPT